MTGNIKVKVLIEDLSWEEAPAGQSLSGQLITQSIPSQEIELTLNPIRPSGVDVCNEEHCWTAFPLEVIPVHNVTCSNIQVMYAWYSMYNWLGVNSKILLGIHYLDRDNERRKHLKKFWAKVLEIKD